VRAFQIGVVFISAVGLAFSAYIWENAPNRQPAMRLVHPRQKTLASKT
jgi:hypothetical protein